jgi:hypothetical protein
MRINYEGESYEFDMADISIKQAIKIERHLGCPIAEFGERLYPSEQGKSPDMMALQCLGWLILHGGKGVPIDDTDFSVGALTKAIGDATIAEQAAEKAVAESSAARPVPTVAADPSANGAPAAGEPLTVP